MSIKVLKAGFQDLIQDMGRFGNTHVGISPSGAADNISLRIGNLLLDNDINAPGIEITLFGGSYYFNKNAIIVLTGSEFTSTIDGKIISFSKPVSVKTGQTLSINQTSDGARCYLCIKGGFQVPPTLNSSSTHILSKIGEPYLKSNYSRNKSKEGLGLGLFIGKTLLEKNFASVNCRNSKTRSGAEIYIKWNNRELFNI